MYVYICKAFVCHMSMYMHLPFYRYTYKYIYYQHNQHHLLHPRPTESKLAFQDKQKIHIIILKALCYVKYLQCSLSLSPFKHSDAKQRR